MLLTREFPTTWQADEAACTLITRHDAPLYETPGLDERPIIMEIEGPIVTDIIATLPEGAGVIESQRLEIDGVVRVHVYSPRVMTNGWMRATDLASRAG